MIVQNWIYNKQKFWNLQRSIWTSSKQRHPYCRKNDEHLNLIAPYIKFIQMKNKPEGSKEEKDRS